jgi:hypothetical protein
MYNFFSKIFSFLKLKKTISIIVIISIIGIFIPLLPAKAITWSEAGGASGCVAGALFGGGAGSVAAPILGTALGGVTGCVVGGLGGYFAGKAGGDNDFTKEIIYAISTLMVSIVISISNLVATLFNQLISGQLISSSYTKSDNIAVSTGWPLSRDIGNMVIVLGFIFVGIATSLRLRDYEAKKLLLPLIIVAIFINFSLLICGIFIDGSNIMLNNFLNTNDISYDSPSSGSTYYMMAFSFSLNGQAKELRELSEDNTTSVAQFAGAAGAIIFLDIVYTVIIIYVFLLLLFRYYALWILTILSPLAFVCYIFPFSRKYFSTWMEQFLKWCFVGTLMALFIFISDKILESQIKGVDLTGGKPLPTEIFIVSTLFLFIGYNFTKQLAPMGANMAMGWAKGVGAFAGGTILGAAGAGGLAGKLLGKNGSMGASVGGVSPTAGVGQRVGQKIQQKATQLGEWTGWVAPGTSNLKRQAQQQADNSEKRAATWTASQRLDQATKGKSRTMTTRQRNDKLEAIKQMSAKGELGKLDLAARQAAVEYASRRGTPASVLGKGDYRAWEFDTGPTGRATTLGADRARAEGLQNNLSNMSQDQLIGVDDRDITQEFMTGHGMNGNIVKKYRTADPVKIAAIKSAATTGHLSRELATARTAGDVNEIRRLTNIQNEAARL